MDLYEALEERRSIRSYKSDPIPEEILTRVLDAFRIAPSAANRQPWRMIVVRDQEKRERLVSACSNQQFLGEAPCVMVACGTSNCGRIGGYTTSMMVDVSIAFTQMILAAHAEGLGTCWLGAFDENAVKEILNIPEEVRVVAVTPLGYPTVKGFDRGRKTLSEIACYDQYE